MFNNKEKPKLIAIRPMLFTFASMILFCLSVFFVLTTQLIGFLVTLLLFSSLIFYCIFKKRYILSLMMLLLSLFSSAWLVVDYALFQKSILDEEMEYEITGRADEFSSTTSYGYSRVLEDCTIKHDGVIIVSNKKVKIFLTGSNIQCGDMITFVSKIENFEYFNATGITPEAVKNINYSANVSFSSIINLEKTNLTPQEEIKLHSLNVLNNNMSEQGSALAYAVIFGDKSFLDFDARNAFTESGMAHILAVSGLHASIIFSLFMLLLRKIKIKYPAKLTIVASFIIFFTYLCDFASSIVRASIMAIVMALTYLKRTKYDMLNILGLAGVVILLFNPLELFNIGFVLSFTCMFSMALWANLSHKFTNIIINKQIYSLVIASTVTSIGTLPCMAFYFGNFSLVSILTNVILLPIFTLTYAILFLIVLICLIIPIPFLLFCSDAVLMTVLDLAKFFTFWEYDYIKILSLGIVGLILSFVLFFVSSQKFNLHNKYKIPLTIFLICCVTFSAFYSSASKLTENQMLKLDDRNIYCITNNNETILLNTFSSSSNIKATKEFLRLNKEYEIDYCYMFSFDFVNLNTIESLSKEFKINNFYLSEDAFIDFEKYISFFKDSKVYVLKDDETYSIANIAFKFHDFGESGYSLNFVFQEKDYLLMFSV